MGVLILRAEYMSASYIFSNFIRQLVWMFPCCAPRVFTHFIEDGIQSG